MTITMNPYLYFTGSCEAALRFYAGCGLGEIRELRRHGEAGVASRLGEAWHEKVLHSVFVGPGIRFMASDGPDSEPMKGCALLIESASFAGASALFERLSDGGLVTVPFARQFWGGYYGNFTDRFGVQWAISCEAA